VKVQRVNSSVADAFWEAIRLRKPVFGCSKNRTVVGMLPVDGQFEPADSYAGFARGAAGSGFVTFYPEQGVRALALSFSWLSQEWDESNTLLTHLVGDSRGNVLGYSARVPEPGSIALYALGLLGIGVLPRTRAQRLLR